MKYKEGDQNKKDREKAGNCSQCSLPDYLLMKIKDKTGRLSDIERERLKSCQKCSVQDFVTIKMNNKTEPLSDIDRERFKIIRGGQLHAIHWLVLFLSVIVTFSAWYFSKAQLKEKYNVQFDRESGQVISLISERMKKYEDGLWGGVAAINMLDKELTYSQWKTFADSLNLQEKYPGVNGIGVIYYVTENNLKTFSEDHRKENTNFKIYPKHNKTEYLPITYIEPVDINRQAVGLDMAHEINRYTAAKNSQQTGKAQITGPIVLVQDEGKTAGFLFYAPFYGAGKYNVGEKNHNNFKGMVYAPFVVKKLMAGALSKKNRHIGVQIFDGEESIYNEHIESEEDFDPNPMFTKKVELDLYGRTWTFDIRSSKSFRNLANNSSPLIILIGAVIIDSLLLFVFIVMSRSNQKALSFADRMLALHLKKSEELKKTNKELEQFAYIASHDLKTPLRGIGNLVSFLEMDLEKFGKDVSENPEFQKNTTRIKSQVQRMENLINGILEYSSVGKNKNVLEMVDIKKIVQQQVMDLNVEDQVKFTGKFPKFKTHRIPLEQIFSNLIGNSVKHHDKNDLQIKVSVSEDDSYYTFAVSDNGPGIDDRYHEKIFEPFNVLNSNDRANNTGIGLSIVKKLIQKYNGVLTLDSEVGVGTRISFTWPKNVSDIEDDENGY